VGGWGSWRWRWRPEGGGGRDGRMGGETERERVYLSPSRRILRRPTRDEFGVVVLQQVFVEAHVFFLGQDGVVGFHAIFLEELGITSK